MKGRYLYLVSVERILRKVVSLTQRFFMVEGFCPLSDSSPVIHLRQWSVCLRTHPTGKSLYSFILFTAEKS